MSFYLFFSLHIKSSSGFYVFLNMEEIIGLSISFDEYSKTFEKSWLRESRIFSKDWNAVTGEEVF
jgi:hypothetical protein